MEFIKSKILLKFDQNYKETCYLNQAIQIQKNCSLILILTYIYLNIFKLAETIQYGNFKEKIPRTIGMGFVLFISLYFFFKKKPNYYKHLLLFQSIVFITSLGIFAYGSDINGYYYGVINIILSITLFMGKRSWIICWLFFIGNSLFFNLLIEKNPIHIQPEYYAYSL